MRLRIFHAVSIFAVLQPVFISQSTQELHWPDASFLFSPFVISKRSQKSKHAKSITLYD